MVLETFLIHELLREDITSAEQNLEPHQDSLTLIALPKKLTADIKACVRIGRAATFAWYLCLMSWLFFALGLVPYHFSIPHVTAHWDAECCFE
jgi:hypothetical protein